MNTRQRNNLVKLADYLDGLPENYKHFDMSWFAGHRGKCELPMDEEVYAAKKPVEFLNNCGTIACAVGHGPAAGIRVANDEFVRSVYKPHPLIGVCWHTYSGRVFGVCAGFETGHVFGFLFGGNWERFDNHHYGAAARIRYFLATGRTHHESKSAVQNYAPYRKGAASVDRSPEGQDAKRLDRNDESAVRDSADAPKVVS